MLGPSTDPDALAAKSFVQLEGVTDEWLENLKVDRIAGGRVPREWVRMAFSKATLDPLCSICITVPPN